MKHVMVLVSVLLCLLLVASCASENEEEYGGAKDSGAGVAPESKIPCTGVEDCDDRNPCTNDDCHEGFCDYESHPIDEDLDGYVSHICGGTDCDDENEAIHPGLIESPYDDEICFDELDNDCDGLTDGAELACQEGNKVIELTTEEELAPAWTDVEIALTVGPFQENEGVRISYVGVVDAVYVTTEDRVWVEDMSLTGDPVSTSILIPLGTLTVELETFLVASNDPEDLILDPEGYFSANIRLRIDTIVSASLNTLPITQDYPMSILSEDMSDSGRWMPRGDTDGDGRDEFDLLVAGAMTYEFAAMEIPLLGEVAATMSGDVQLGFRGEAL